MPVRRALAAILALPVLASVYASAVLHRGPAVRAALALAVGGTVVAVSLGAPTGTVGVPTATQAPLAASALGPVVVTGRELRSALVVDFDAPMDTGSVAAAVRVEPSAGVELEWSTDGRQLAVIPTGHWLPATYYTVTVGTTARGADGRSLGTPLRAGFLTRSATSASLAAVHRLPSGVALDSAIAISYDRPVPVASVQRAVRVSPAVAGTLTVASDGPDGRDPALAQNFMWRPKAGFSPQTSYSVTLAGDLVDADGAPVVLDAPLTFTTPAAPSVVRFRPRAGTEDVARDADMSVRFTAPMDRASTRAAFSVEVNGTRVKGGVQFAEDDTVLVFDPTADLPYGASVVLRVAGSARDANGTPLDRPRAAGFTVAAKPKPASAPKSTAQSVTGSAPTPAPKATPAPAPKATPAPAPVPRPTSSTWVAAEKYLLTLLNCTRGGGWVLADGSCSSPGGSGIGALAYDAGISSAVARPYAKKIALSGACSHFSGGDPGDRLRAAGYTSYRWAENIGCRYFSDPRDAAVSLVRYFQSEKSWSPVGGHYVNMMNPTYTRAGIGLWVSGGNLRFVVDFYAP